MSPANLDFIASEEMVSSQNIPESLAPDLDLEYIYKFMATPLDSQTTQEIPPNLPLFRDLDPSPQTPSPVDNTTGLCLVRSASASPPPSTPPPNWQRIPQNAYDHGKKQWNFTRSEDISFGVNGRPGVNMRDALRKRFTGLDGRDELVLQDASSVISCRLLVRLSQ